jgi:hypothetical protein
MKTLNTADARQWCERHQVTLGPNGKPVLFEAGLFKSRLAIPTAASKHFAFCRLIEEFLRPWGRCLLWLTEWGVWESSENWHLFYRLRQSYGDNSLIEENPAQLFLEHEDSDLISYIQIGISAGWDFVLLTNTGYSRISISHDEWIEFIARDELELISLRERVTTLNIQMP